MPIKSFPEHFGQQRRANSSIGFDSISITLVLQIVGWCDRRWQYTESLAQGTGR